MQEILEFSNESLRDDAKGRFCSNIVHNGANLLLAFCQQIDRPLEDGQTCKKQKRRHIDTQAVSLNTGSEIIQATELEKLLGYEVHQNLGFGTFLMTGKSSVLSSLSKRIGALKSIAKVSNFKTRLSVCSSLVMSRILYMLPLFGGAPNYMLDALQKKQNEAMRLVTKRKWGDRGQLISTRELLKQCNFLSVRQMVY